MKKKNPERMVLVVAREIADLVKLSSSESPMNVPCGAVGRIIAKKVLDGEGKALVRASDIKMSIDNTDGVHAILDNFDLFDERTSEPLLYLLIKNL
jgi:hypothetical protein